MRPGPVPSPSSGRTAATFALPKDPKFEDIAYYAERSHLSDLADPERAYLQQWQEEYPEADPRTAYDISGDAANQRFAVLADAARTGHRSGKYVAPAVENVRGYFQRAINPLIDEVQDCKDMLPLDQAAVAGVNDLIQDLEDDTV